jgi:hypothetical protein
MTRPVGKVRGSTSRMIMFAKGLSVLPTAKIEEHQREIVKAENSHRTAAVNNEVGSDDKGKRIN